MLSSSVERVPRSTASEVNERIRRDTESNIAYYATAGSGTIAHRLVELDREWDIERALAVNFGVIGALTILLGFAVSALWFAVAGISGGFLVLHGIQGWCPPLPIFRRLGFRTRSEIEIERHALKVMRGDYRALPTLAKVAGKPELIRRVLQAVRLGGDRPGAKVGRLISFREDDPGQ